MYTTSLGINHIECAIVQMSIIMYHSTLAMITLWLYKSHKFPFAMCRGQEITVPVQSQVLYRSTNKGGANA